MAKTIAQILKKGKLEDILVAGKLRWRIASLDYGGLIIAFPANKATKFELWSAGVESVAIIPGLKIAKPPKTKAKR
jgi:hypothetical protein